MKELKKILWLNKYIGLKFKDHARGPKEFDCYGLYWYIRVNEFDNINLPSYDDKYNSYKIDNIKSIMDEEQLKWIKIKDNCARLGDLIRLRIICSNTTYWHVGMILNSKYMLHIREGIDSCVTSYIDKIWRNKKFGIYRPNF